MFETKLPDGQAYLFVEAPPLFKDDENSSKRPQRPKGLPDSHWSIFFYWWAFLRLNQDYLECCRNGGNGPLAELYQDFGDVRDGVRPHKHSDPGQPIDEFTEWWCDQGSSIFREPNKMPPEVLTEYPHEVVLQFKSHAMIWVWLDSDIDYVMSEIRKILTPRIAAFRDTNWENELPYYRVHGKYTLQSLDNTLRIWNAKRRLEQEKPGQKILQPSIFDAAKIEIGNVMGLDAVEIEQKKGKQVSEALSRARRLIANVGLGRFPDFSPPIAGEAFTHPRVVRQQMREATMTARLDP